MSTKMTLTPLIDLENFGHTVLPLWGVRVRAQMRRNDESDSLNLDHFPQAGILLELDYVCICICFFLICICFEPAWQKKHLQYLVLMGNTWVFQDSRLFSAFIGDTLLLTKEPLLEKKRTVATLDLISTKTIVSWLMAGIPSASHPKVV